MTTGMFFLPEVEEDVITIGKSQRTSNPNGFDSLPNLSLKHRFQIRLIRTND